MTEEQLAAIQNRLMSATTGPWIDLTKRFAEACDRDHKKRGRWWHGSRKESLPLCLIACDSVRGEQIDDSDIPIRVDYWDLTKVIGIRWSELKHFSFAGSLSNRNVDFIAHSWEDVRNLLNEVHRLRRIVEASATNESDVAEEEKADPARTQTGENE